MRTVGVREAIDDPLDIAFGVEHGSSGDGISIDMGEPFMSVQVFLDGEDKLHVTDYEL